MFCLFCTIPAKDGKVKNGGSPAKPSRARSIITWGLVFIWIFLIAFGLVAAQNPSWLQSFARTGREGESSQVKQNGDLFLKSRNFPKALALYNMALQINPENTGAIVNSAIAYNNSGHPEAGLRMLENAIKQNPKLIGTLYYNIAEILESMNRYPEALEYYEKVIGTEIQPDVIYKKLIQLYKKTDQLDKAYQAAETLLEVQTNPLTPYLNMLRRYSSTYSKSSSHYQYFENELNRELTIDALSDYDIETIINLNKSNREIAKTYNYLAVFCILRGDIEKAIKHLERSNEIWPGNKDAAHNLKILRAAQDNTRLTKSNTG